ncbi:protein kinase [candidate division KSB1 bacterium]|nr:protein kinase [candidate division KSB1 bacterium]
MGEVYLAEDLKLERNVALKFLPSHLTKDDIDLKRFVQEARAAAALNHPNVCTIHEINNEGENPFIVMEYVEGNTLRHQISRGDVISFLPTQDVIHITLQITEALKAAHEKGIIHRDIKPDNIMLTPEGRVKVMDFGLARLDRQSRLTKTGSTMGTVAYMSPEQVKGETVDHRTDIWSLGVVLYEMATGQLPFRGDYDQAVIYAILNEEPAHLQLNKDHINKHLEEIITKALKKNPDDRYRTMTALRSDLEKIENQLAKQTGGTNKMNKAPKPSLAVLPFVNMSADPGNEYFSDGLTEELINALTKLKDFRVVARTSAFAFKGKQADIRDIGNQLGVQQVLEGSVRKFGNRIRITAQLIAIEDGCHLWSETYDRDLEDVFVIQDEISAEIAAKLQSEFIESARKVHEDMRPDLETYELYLKGRYYFNKFSPEWILGAQQTFLKAIALDPTFAPTHAGLADTYVILTNPIGLLDGREALPKARAAAEEALRLDPNLSEAYAALGSVATYLDWDSKKAQAFFEKAIELNPDNVISRLWYELALSLLDQNFDKALDHMNYALKIDPLNLLILLRTGYLNMYKYEYDTAIQYFKRIISIEPEIVSGHHGLLDVYGLKGEYELAYAEGELVRKLANDAPPMLAVLGLYYARGGKRKEAEDILSSLLKRYESEPISPFWIGVIYMGLEQYKEMYAWYNTAFEKRDSNLLYTFAPPFDPIRGDTKFKALREKMGFKA